MGVDETDRGFLAGEIGEETRQERVLENVGEIAGVEGVAVVHRFPSPALAGEGVGEADG
jgi:hypothetical protein